MSKYLILGSEGFIGKNTVTYFLHKNGIEVYGIDIQTNNSQDYNYFKIDPINVEYSTIMNKNFDVVINCAGSGSVPMAMENPLQDFTYNCFDTARILNCIRLSKFSTKYIHISSAAVYGNCLNLPINESSELKPVSSYGWHKIIAENICKEYFDIYNLPISILRPFSVYGPGLKKQLFWDWRNKIKSGVNPILLMGTGNESRDFIYIKDLLFAIECIINNSTFIAEAYNVGSGIESTISLIANIFFKEFENVKYEFNGQVRPGDPIKWKADIGKLALLGFKSKYDLKSGMKELVHWMKNLKNEED